MGLKSSDNPQVFVGPTTLDCGCSCKRDVSGYLVWTRCPLHAHAEDLFEACTEALAQFDLGPEEYVDANIRRTIRTLQRAIDKAQGEADSPVYW